TVAHHQALAVLAAVVGEPLDVVVGLGPKRGRDHPARALARELIQRDRDPDLVLPDGEPANIVHGVPSFAASRRSVLINREGTPPCSSGASTTSGYSSDELVARGLAARSVNMMLDVLAQVLDDAVEYKLMDVNPARGRRRRMKVPKPARGFLEPDMVIDLLDAA